MAAREFGFIDPASSVLTVSGLIIAGGWTKGEYVNIKYNSDQFGLIVGSAGDATRSKSNDRSAEMTVKLLQTSRFNTYFLGLFKLDQGTGRFPFPWTFSDPGNLESFISARAWIVKPPDAGFGTEDIPREWKFATADLEPIRL